MTRALLTITGTLLLTMTRALLTITGTLLLAVTGTLLLAVTRMLLTAGAEITVLVTVTLVVVTVFVALLVEVLTIAHNGRMRDDARAEADRQHCCCGAGDGRALAPRGLLRCRHLCRGASSHGLVTHLIVGRSPRHRLQGRASKRIVGLLLGDGRHLRRFRLRRMGGQHLGLLRNLRL